MFDQLSVYISANWTAVHASGWVLFPCDFRDFQSFNSSKKKKKLSNPCFLFDVKKYKCEVGMNRCMPLLGCRHTHSHTAKSRYSVYISQNGCVGLETSKGKCFLSSAMLLLQSTRPVSLSLLGQHLSNWYWSETIHVLTKTKFRKKLCNINHIFRWCVLISTLSFLGASPAWTPALTECPCSGGGCQLLRMAHGLNFNEILMVFDVFLKAPLLPRGTRLWANS